MRRVILLAGVGAVLAVGTAVGATQHQVSLTPTGPQPAELRITWGDSVSFANPDTVAQTLQIPRLDVTSNVEAGATVSQTFAGRGGIYSFRQRAGNRLHSGRIIVDVSGELELAVSPREAVYGQSVKVTGRSPFGESPVELEAQPAGSGSRIPLGTVTPQANGSFATAVRLERSGRVVAFAAQRQLRSAQLPVSVKPLLTVTAAPRRAAVGTFVKVTGRLRPATAAAAATMEQFDVRRKRWVRFKTARVGTTGLAAFSFRATKGATRVRLNLPRSSLREGYTTVTSKIVTVTGT